MSQDEVHNRDASRNIRSSYADGATFSLMVGFGETYLPAFALAIGLSQLTAGFLTSIPLIAGGLLQLLAPRAALYVGSYRRWVLLCASTQALTYVPLVIAALYGAIPMWALFAVAALYWTAGMAAGPAWNNWIDTIIPKSRLRDFLAVRSRITQAAACLAFLAGGILLQKLAVTGHELYAFAALFAAAGLCRLVSTLCLARQEDATAREDLAPALSVSQVIVRFREPGTGRFLFFMLASQVSVHIAAPFFSPYMLAHPRTQPSSQVSKWYHPAVTDQTLAETFANQQSGSLITRQCFKQNATTGLYEIDGGKIAEVAGYEILDTGNAVNAAKLIAPPNLAEAKPLGGNFKKPD